MPDVETLMYVVEQVFLPLGRSDSRTMQIHSAQQGEGGGQRAEKKFYVSIFLKM